MPTFSPFRATKYDADFVDANDVTCPPYDVINAAQREALVRRSIYNAVRLELPVDEAGVDRYASAQCLLSEWLDDGPLTTDDAARFYAYRMKYVDAGGQPRETLGVLGVLKLEPFDSGDVIPHERTLPKAKSDRLDLLRATRTNLSPVWGLSMSSGLTELLSKSGSPTVRTTNEENIVHEFWPINDEQVCDNIAKLVNDSPVLIADGHHRYETGLTYQRETTGNAATEPGAESIFTYVVELRDDQIHVGSIHRILNSSSKEATLASLGEAFDLAPLPTLPRDEAGLVALLLDPETPGPLVVSDAQVFQATAKSETKAKAEFPTDPSHLDVAVTTSALEVTYDHHLDDVLAHVAQNPTDVAVLVRSVSTEVIGDAARRRVRMPPKSTLFTPKPQTGFAFRRLDAQ